MSAEAGSPPIPDLPEELRLLRMLHNVGATASEKALSVEEICQWTEMEASNVQPRLQKLAEMGYVEVREVDGTNRYNVTLEGMRKVLSMYS